MIIQKETKEKQKKEIKKEKPVKKPATAKASAGKADFGINIDDMAKAGLHFGHRTSNVHPKMKPYLAGVRNTVHIINLEETAEKLKSALKFIQELVSEKKVLLLVGTKIQVKNLVKEIAEQCELPYVNERWLGGTFTNFKIIKKRIEYFKDLEKKKKQGELKKYTKKEQGKIDQQLRNFEIKFGGIKNLSQLPDAVFILDIRKDVLTIKESKAQEIKTIGISDTNTDPSLVDYPIPANDDAISSVKYILEKAAEVIKNAKH